MLGYNVCFRGFSLSMEYSCSRLRLLHNLACAATGVNCEWRRIVVQGLCVPGDGGQRQRSVARAGIHIWTAVPVERGALYTFGFSTTFLTTARVADSRW